MATVEGLNLRGSRWSLRILIPDDLKQVYGTTRKNIALGTADRKEAVLRGTLKRAEWLAEFEQKRKELNPSPLESVSQEMAQRLAEMVRAEVLTADDTLREDRAVWADLARVAQPTALLIPQDRPETFEDPLAGLGEVELEAMKAFNAHLDGKAAVALAARNLSAVLPVVKRQALKLGVSFDHTAPGAKEALVQCLKAYREAYRDKVLRDAGEVVDTPAVTIPPPGNDAHKEQPRTLREVFDKWKQPSEKPRSKDTITAMDRALRQFESQYPSVPLESITRAMGHEYRAWLLSTDLASKTANDRLTQIKTLLKFASQELEWMLRQRQPWEGLEIEVRTENPRRPWNKEELEVLFSSPLHTRYDLPTTKEGGRDAAYWVPLLALYTGARAGELCQLQTVDVQDMEGMPVLGLTDDGEDQKIKSKAGHRTIPIHSELIRLGFLDYVESVRRTGSASLWPALPLRKGKPSDLFGRWFLEHRKALGLPGKGGPSMHYFRHTVRPLMRRAGFDSKVQDKITGHETRGSVGDEEYDHVLMEELQPAVEAIRFPYLNLPRVYRKASA